MGRTSESSLGKVAMPRLKDPNVISGPSLLFTAKGVEAVKLWCQDQKGKVDSHVKRPSFRLNGYETFVYDSQPALHY